MAIFDMGNMPLDEFCKRLNEHPEQDKEVSAEMIKKIFPECQDITTKDDRGTDAEHVIHAHD